MNLRILSAFLSLLLTAASSPAISLNSGAPVTGSIDAEDEVDVYTISMDVGDSLLYALMELGENSVFAPRMSVYRPDGSWLQSTGTGTGIATTSGFRAESAGVYQLRVADSRRLFTGTYRLVVVNSPDDHQDPDGRLLATGETIEKNLRIGDFDVFTIELPPGGYVLASIGDRSPGNGFNPTMRLYGPDGKREAFNSYGNNIDHRSTEGGLHTLVVSDSGANDPGNYRLTATVAPGLQQDSNGTVLEAGKRVKKVLRNGDIDIHTFEGVAGGAVSFSLTDNVHDPAFQPSISLHGPRGQWLCGTYEYGQGTVNLTCNSLPEDGEYYVFVVEKTGRSDGSYTLVPSGAIGRKQLDQVTVLTHGFGNPSTLRFGGVGTPFRIGIPDFLDGWEQLSDELLALPGNHGVSLKQEVYVADWPSCDGWLQAVGAVFSIPFASASWTPYLLSYADEEMIRAALHAEAAAETIVDGLARGGLLSEHNPPEIHLVGHSRGAAVNARASRLLHQRGFTPTQYTALDGYSTDWPGFSNILADLSITSEVSGIPGMRKVNVLVEDGLDEAALRAILNSLETANSYVADWLELPTPEFSEPTVNVLKDFTFGWKAPWRANFDNYVMEGCYGKWNPTNHVNVTPAYTHCLRPETTLRAIMDSPLGSAILDAPPSSLPNSHGAAPATTPASTPSIPLGIRNGDFDALGELAEGMSSLDIPDGLDPLFETIFTSLQQPKFVISSSWDVAGEVDLVAQSGGYAVALTQGEQTSISQLVKFPMDARSVTFDLEVQAAGIDAALEITADDSVVGSIDLATASTGRWTISLFGHTSRVTRIGFRLGGVSPTPATVVVDNVYLSTEQGLGYPVLEVLNILNGSEGRVVTVRLTGSAGRTFLLQTSSDLSRWEDDFELVPSADTGTIEFSYNLAPDVESFYFRISNLLQ